MLFWERSRGFSLLELVIAIAVLGALLSAVAPTFQDASKKLKVTRAANELYALLMQTKAESIAQNTPLWVHFSGFSEHLETEYWSVEVTNRVDINDPDARLLRQIKGEVFKGIGLSLNHSNHRIKFDNLTGMALSNGTIKLQPYSDEESYINIRTHSVSGRVIVCDVGEIQFGFGACPK
ncbi:GspH/FimT family pseudopilin [Vibrio sp. CyArs1]|uniref:GspH/FimT family pseudopilin n=1 Tax=Vibrio sp. CyArs1 TaxID=2682577 RepID=UPI0021BC421F|nr:GspH/FimT family pseudopilin [Vibrio sp. CyArs1]